MTIQHRTASLSILAAAFFMFPAMPGMAEETKPANADPAAPKAVHVATVDMQELVKEYPRTAEFQKQMELDRARVLKEDADRVAKIKLVAEKREELRKELDDPSVSEGKKQTLFKEMQEKTQEAEGLDRERREFQQRKSQAINEKAVRDMKVLFAEVRKIVEDQAKLDNFDFVFDRSGLSASQVPMMLYTKDSTDITPAMLKLVKQAAQPEGAGSGK